MYDLLKGLTVVEGATLIAGPTCAPRFGEHTDEVLAELLGHGASEIGSLHDAGIVGQVAQGRSRIE